MSRHTRYQAAILRGDHILLIRHYEHEDGRTYWLLPGGGREPGESEEDCVRREMREETNLEVSVERLLLEDHVQTTVGYQCYKTYVCRVVSGAEKPGYEPEESASSVYAIVEVGWFDLCNPQGWGELILKDTITFPLLQRIRTALGYTG